MTFDFARTRSRLFSGLLVALFLGALPATAVAQGAAKSAPKAVSATPAKNSVELIGLDGKRRVVTAAELARMPRVDATVSSHNVQGTYSGVSLGALLRLVDRPAGEALRGKALTTAVSVEAADGYRVIFALAELDSGFTTKKVFLADRKNGAAIDASEGPLRVIVPDEARPARWAKQITRIRLIAVK